MRSTFIYISCSLNLFINGNDYLILYIYIYIYKSIEILRFYIKLFMKIVIRIMFYA